MNLIEDAIATLGIPGSIAVVLVMIFAVLQLIGEFIEAFGKVAPTFLKVRKIFIRRKQLLEEQTKTLKEVQELLQEVNKHYAPDNIAKRDDWMTWVNSRAEIYDQTIVDYRAAIEKITNSLDNNTKMTEQMFIESSRDRIIDFASKVLNPVSLVSREEFNRIFKIYQKYEEFLEEHNMSNGEVELNYSVIKEAYLDHLEGHKFVEDMRDKKE